MRVERFTVGEPREAVARVRATASPAASVEQPVREIVERVRREGDAAVLEYTRRFDTRGADPPPIPLADGVGFHDQHLMSDAFAASPPELRAALDVARANISDVAQAWMGVHYEQVPVEEGPPVREVRLRQGHRIVLREVPVRSAAVYVPGGRAPYPSTLLMGVMTARIAGVPGSIVVCTPPQPDGSIDPAVLAACCSVGGVRLFRMGGAQAIAALAYGTESVPRVDVIVGPGNLFVQEAKRQVSDRVGIDGFAGPSDLLVIMDEDVDVGPVALDLVAQGEHGAGTVVVALCESRTTLTALSAAVRRLSRRHQGPEPARCFLLRASLDSARAFVDDFAPEHLQLVGTKAERLVERVRSAGAIFVGPQAGTAFGDYVAGSNHILPTGGAARFSSSLHPGHFLRRRAEVHLTRRSAAELAPPGAAIARAEGFEAHARSMEARMGENPAP